MTVFALFQDWVNCGLPAVLPIDTFQSENENVEEEIAPSNEIPMVNDDGIAGDEVRFIFCLFVTLPVKLIYWLQNISSFKRKLSY